MGKRCEGCQYLAQDGSCLIAETLPEECPRKETKYHEEKDEWMDKVGRKRAGKTKGGIGTVSLEDV